MHKYLNIQEAPITDNITTDGHVGAQTPWPITADSEGLVHLSCRQLGMHCVLGFQKDLAVMGVNLWWDAAFADPDKAVGMYAVIVGTDGSMGVRLTAVDRVAIIEVAEPFPLEDQP